MMRILCICIFTLNVESLPLRAEELQDGWVGDWLQAMEFSKEQEKYGKSIAAYTAAIDRLQLLKHKQLQLEIINERGNLLFKMLNFSDAINDFSYVLEHSLTNQEQRIEALWGRSKAYLGSGLFQKFQEDMKRLDQLQDFIQTVVDTANYSIIKVNPFVFRESTGRERFIKLLLMRNEISSDKDVFFTHTGLVIIKKMIRGCV